jgi:addiction module HigA family antidote
MATSSRKPPAHPGSVLADILDEQRISLRKAAKAIGMSPMGLQKVLSENGPVTTETALRLGTWLGNGPDLWLNLQRAYDLFHAEKELRAELKQIKPLAD